MDIGPDADQESQHERWLADFLDWYDSRGQQDSANASTGDCGAEAQTLVEAFLHEFASERGGCNQLRRALVALATDMLPARRLAADAVTCWLGPVASPDSDESAGSAPENLPRQFGDYELLERIGHGGMGVVYRARQESLGRTVCIKMLPPGLLEPRRMRRFADESRLGGCLHHPGIVPIFDAGSHRGQPYYVMELVEGESLAERIARQPLAARQAAVWLCDIAAAVQFAHDAGVLHRDLKPANVLIDRHERVRVADFGLARHVDDSATEVGIAGTPSYMAVEQVRGRPADRRTDVYGLGAILYEMLSGRPPHVGNSPAETMRLVSEEPPIQISQLRPGMPRDLETICHKCLEKNPQRRYESAGALRDDLSRFLRNEPVLARPVGLVERSFRWMQRHPAVAMAGAISCVSLLILITGGAFALWKTQSALDRTRTAEATQRRLAGQLALAKKASDAALYRSLIVQTVRSLETLDVDAARRSLQQIDVLTDFTGTPAVEYRLLHRQAYPETASLAANGAAVRDAGWTGEGATIVALLDDGGIGVFDPNGDLRTRASMGGSARALAVHPSQPLAAVADRDGKLQIWNTSPLELRSQIQSPPADQIVWHPSSSELIALSDDGVLSRVVVETGEVAPVATLPERPERLAMSPDGARLAVATQDNNVFSVALAKTATGEPGDDRERAVLVGSTDDWIVDLAWAAPNGRRGHALLAAIDEQGRVTAWSLDTSTGPGAERSRELISVSSGPSGEASLSWAGDDLIVGHAVGQVSAVDLQGGSVRWSHPCQPLRKLVVQPRGEQCLLLHEGKRSANLWNLDELGVGVPLYSSRVPLRSITTGDLGRFVGWRDIDGQVGIAASATPESVVAVMESAVGASALAASPTQPRLAVTRDSDVVVYRYPSLETVTRFAEHESTVWLLEFSSDAKWLASGDGAGRIGLTCMDDSQESRLLESLDGEVRAVAFSPDSGQLAAMDGSGRLSTWDLPAGERVERLLADDAVAHALVYVNDNQVAIGDSTGDVRLVDLAAGAELRRWKAHDGPVWSLLKIGARIISAGQDGSICISDASGVIYHRLPKQSTAVWSLAYDPTSGYLWATTVSGEALRWQTQTASKRQSGI